MKNSSSNSRGPRNRRKSTSGAGHSAKGHREQQSSLSSDRRSTESNHPRPSQGGNYHSKRRKHYQRRPSPLSDEKSFLREYEFFIKKHDEARKRYFEHYHFSDDQRRRHLEVNFFKAVEKLRKFENQITEKQWAMIHRKKWKIYHLDSTYSTNHNLMGPEASVREFTDSMMTSDQLNRKSFQEDTEESMGTPEDYKEYQQEKS